MARTAHPHLPPGVEPGPQSRRLRLGRGVFGCVLPFLVIGGLLFGLGFAGAAFLVTALPGESAPSPLPFAAAAVGGPAIFWVIAFVFWRQVHPRRSRGLAAAVDRQRVRAGEPLGAQLTAGEPGTELGLVCRVHYDVWHRSMDSTDRVTAKAIAWERWTPAGPTGATFTVPPDGPPSYEGAAVSFAWAVHARPAGGGPPSDPVPVWVEP
ncbi:MAG: hypothetical protein M3417_15895 [Actinomycetota bacterium]|nr:hypothetical protein [Actinomycetota bacterium]